MANLDTPCGFRPKGEPIRVNKYVAGGAVYPGDCVKMDNTGRVVVAAASNALLGVAASYAAAAGADVLVWDHPDQMFIGQTDDGTIDTQTELGLNANIVAGTASTLYKISRHEIDGDSGATSSILPLRLIASAEVANDSLATGTNCKLVVKINNHLLNGGTGTEGL